MQKTTLKLKSYSDDGHGWIAVKRSVLIQFGLLDKISPYSYQSKTGSTIYLEEDADATLFVNTLRHYGVTIEFLDVRHNGRSYIRSLPHFESIKKVA